MKKIILTAAIALGTLTAMNAQEKKTETMAMTKTEVKTTVAVQDNYKAITAEKLPQAVKEATLTKAFANDKDEYKLVITTADKAEKTVYANSKGEWIKKQ